MKGTTIPHQVTGWYGSAQVLLKPASEGTGVIAGGPVRKVMQVAGITNVLTKSIGTSNPHNVVKATFCGAAQPEGRRPRCGKRVRRRSKRSAPSRPRGGEKTEKRKGKQGNNSWQPRRKKGREERRHAKSEVGGEFHQLHRRHAGNDSRPRAAQIATGGGSAKTRRRSAA